MYWRMKATNDQSWARLALKDNLSYRLSILGFLMGRLTNKIYTAEGLRSQEWKVLSVVNSFGPLAPTEIGNWVTLDKAAISRALRELCRLGHVERHLSRTDGRSITISITETGRQVYARMTERTAQLQKRLFSGSNAAEIRAFFTQIDALEAHLRDEIEPGTQKDKACRAKHR
jgi:DNA-binding MarR family transcriptional regulator